MIRIKIARKSDSVQIAGQDFQTLAIGQKWVEDKANEKNPPWKLSDIIVTNEDVTEEYAKAESDKAKKVAAREKVKAFDKTKLSNLNDVKDFLAELVELLK